MSAGKQERRTWLLIGAAGLAVLVALPFALAGGLGRLIGGLWVTVMGAVMRLVGAMFGA